MPGHNKIVDDCGPANAPAHPLKELKTPVESKLRIKVYSSQSHDSRALMIQTSQTKG